MERNPSDKYNAFNPPDLHDRTWPSKRITSAPRWLATDLRDGNQSLASPMTVEQKWKYFQLLVDIGYKEIDISFPSASDTEFAFTRKVVASAPSDVWLQVLSPCRKDLIRTTVDSVTGARKAIISLYIASSDAFISTIFNSTREKVMKMAVECVQYTKSITKDDPTQQNTEWNLMFSPEAFSDTDPSYAIALCEAVKEAWQPSREAPMILNLPATVERSSPNTFADQVEIFCRGITEKEKVVVSLHPHNDRGCAVAAAELGQMAGASRVEGCLFGNGERTGNVDLVTLALNLYSQGINPGLDFSDLPYVKQVVEELTKIPVHLRAPYAGDAVFLAYSGSHQDAINKGFKRWDNPPEGNLKRWDVPYLAIDPKDIGASYEAVIKVNSQSGKGGIAWTLRDLIDKELPAEFQRGFSKVVKRESEAVVRSLDANEIISIFMKEYGLLEGDERILDLRVSSTASLVAISASVFIQGLTRELFAQASDVASALSQGLYSSANLAVQFECHPRTLTLRNGTTWKFSIVKCTELGSSEVSWAAKAGRSHEEANVTACLSAALAFEDRWFDKTDVPPSFASL